MADNITVKDWREYDEILTSLANGEVLIRDLSDNTIKRIQSSLLLGGIDTVEQWNSTTTYNIPDIISYNSLLWESLQDNNLNNPPVEGSYWTQVNKSASNGFGRYAVGVYTVDPTMVMNGDTLYGLSESTTLPFNSTDFATELANGDWVTLSGDAFNKIDLNPQSTPPAHQAGRMYFDSVQDAMVYYNSVAGISQQLGLEIWVRCYNDSGSIIADGKPVYISGADVASELPEINLADSNYYEKSRVIGLATHSIGIGEIGYVAFFGVINDYNATGFSVGDIIYLSSGGTVKNTSPADGEFATRLGVIIKEGVTGKIQLSISTSQYTVETVEQNGFPDTSNLNVTFDDPTYTLTVAPIDAIRVRYYGKGIKYFSEGAGDTFQISDVSGLHFIYYDNGVLTEVVDPTLSQQVSILSNYASVTSIYWRAGDRQIYFGNQAHSSIGYGSRQIGLDQVKFGAEYVPGSGLGLNDFVIGSGALDSHAQFSISSGQISNSDLLITTPAFASTVGVEVAYIDTTGIWERATNAGFSFLNTGTGRVAYQDPVLGGLVEVTDGNYVLYHIVATNDYTSAKRVFAIPGLAEYTSVANAEDAAREEAATILESAPINELVIVGIDIIQTKDSYANSVKARIVQTTDGENYIDTRTSGVSGGGGSTPQTTFSDAEFSIFNVTDVSKEGAFSNTNVPTSTKRLIDFEYLYNISLARIFNAGKTFYTSLVSAATAANYTATLPAKSGTIAFLEDANRSDLSFALSDETSDLTTTANDGKRLVPRAQTLTAIKFAVNIAPSGSSIKVDVLKNGVTILTTPIELTSGSTVVTITTPQISTTSLSVDDVLTADITQIGAVTAGAGAKIYPLTNLT